jgi:hypothetical protein
MYSKQAISAIAAFGMVSGVVGQGVSCEDPTATIASPADATEVANCRDFEGSILISDEAGPTINLDGLTEVGGDLIAENNELLADLSSSTLRTIGGSFRLHNLIGLVTLEFPSLGAARDIDFATLTKLAQIGFGSDGITEAETVIIADTTIDSIDGINVESLQSLNLNNNKRLTRYTSSMRDLSNTFIVNNNGLNFTMELPELVWIANMTVGNVTQFSAPSLETVNGSMYFDSNFFTSFSMPNLTEVDSGSLSFVSNSDLANLTFPALERVGGGLTIANNTELGAVDGFPELTNIGGAIALRGSFTSAELPSLEDVIGGYDVQTTARLDEATCSGFADQKSSGVIQGPEIACQGDTDDANSDTSGADGEGSGNSSNREGEGNAGALVGINMWAMVGLAGLGAFFTTL